MYIVQILQSIIYTYLVQCKFVFCIMYIKSAHSLYIYYTEYRFTVYSVMYTVEGQHLFVKCTRKRYRGGVGAILNKRTNICMTFIIHGEIRYAFGVITYNFYLFTVLPTKISSNIIHLNTNRVFPLCSK